VTVEPIAGVESPENGVRVCVVGPGTHFLSAMTYYSFGLVAALARKNKVSAILVRRLIPARLYPGRARVGATLSDLRLPPEVVVVDDVDWYWGPGMLRALRLLRSQRVEVLVLEWWTGSVLHTYLVLGLAARLLGARVVVEFHEVLDTAEDKLGWVRRYVDAVAPTLFRLSSAFVVHNEHDRELVMRRYGLPIEQTVVIRHPSFDPHGGGAAREAREGPCRLLFFGLVRPFKGVEDLVVAFEQLVEGLGQQFELTIVGETWEGWDLPDRLIRASTVRDRIHRVDRFVTDAEAAAHFRQADVVVLPYRRCSSSGPLHTAMALGLPIVTTRVGGLPEATAGYPGVMLAEPANPESLGQAIVVAAGWRGRQFARTDSWQDSADRYDELFDAVMQTSSQIVGDSAQ
jgi:glycosyltransferase involved in cell wall biosynthesis